MSVLQYARDEQKVNAARLSVARAYRTAVLEETFAASSARVDSLQAAAAGRPLRALQMRSAKADVRAAVIADVRSYPHEPHKWNKITRDVAFLEGEEFAENVLPLDKRAIDREYEKGRKANHRASQAMTPAGGLSGTVGNKEEEGSFQNDGVSPAQALKSFRMHLNLSMFDDEVERHLDDELASLTGRGASLGASDFPDAEASLWSGVDNDAEGQPQQRPGRMAHLKAVTNPTLSTFVEQASGPGYDALMVKARIKKNKADRHKMLVPSAREVRDAETGEITELNTATYVHYEDRLDEGRSMAVLGVVGKLKSRLSMFRSGGGGAGSQTESPTPLPPSSSGTSVQSISSRSSPVSTALGAIKKSSSSSAFADLLTGVSNSSPSPSPSPSVSVPPSAAPSAPRSPVDWEAVAGQHLAAAVAVAATPSAPTGGASRKSTKESETERLNRVLEYQDRQIAKERTVGGGDFNDSFVSDFDYLGSTPHSGGGLADRRHQQQATPLVDIGAADNLHDLVGWADSAVKRQVVELSVLKDKKNRELLDLVRAEEEEEARRKKVERANPHPARLERLRVRHDKERKERRAVIERIRQENELVIANKLAEWGLIR